MNNKITLNETLLDLVRDKSIVAVGPAPYLIGSKLGAIIDSYDIICRSNEIIPQPNIRGDYGSKTDILFSNFGTPWMRGIKTRINELDTKEYFKKLKMVVCGAIKSEHSEVNYLSWNNDYVSKVVENFTSINEFNLPFYWIGVKDYKTLYNEIGTEFTTGVSILAILLCYPIKELFITGYTFFSTGNTYAALYRPGYIDEIDKHTVFKNGVCIGHGTNTTSIQIKYLKKLLNIHSNKIKIDSKLNVILNLNHCNVMDLSL